MDADVEFWRFIYVQVSICRLYDSICFFHRGLEPGKATLRFWFDDGYHAVHVSHVNARKIFEGNQVVRLTCMQIL